MWCVFFAVLAIPFHCAVASDGQIAPAFEAWRAYWVYRSEQRVRR
jgi:hypothetical protein